MTRSSLAGIPCSIARSLDVVGEWWTLLVLRDLFYGLERFEQIVSDLGISRAVLTSRLKSLEAAELIERRRYQTAPDRFSYHLTAAGEDLFGVLLTLMTWGDAHQRPFGEPVPVSLLCRSCESETAAVACCASCGEPLRPDGVGVRPNLGQRTPRTRLSLRPASADPRPDQPER